MKRFDLHFIGLNIYNIGVKITIKTFYCQYHDKHISHYDNKTKINKLYFLINNPPHPAYLCYHLCLNKGK